MSVADPALQILVVDDSADDARAVRATLEASGGHLRVLSDAERPLHPGRAAYVDGAAWRSSTCSAD